jgi:crotonobetainyl-CoA:carnitine CoA-transferase CaiB-like acyl-CoA transferase
MKHGPLSGIRVLDFSHVLAGPVCTRLLADLGAEVLRIESTKRADTPWRSESDPKLGRTLAYIMAHRGKQSITVNLKSEAGAEVAKRLAAVADVVVENFSAGVMSRLGLDFQNIAALNPRLIFLSMSGYGHNGPRKDWTSMNTNLQAYSGLMMASEEEGNPPVAVSNSWMDYVGGLQGCYSVMQALAQRRKDGKGRNIDLAQFEAGVASLGSLLVAGILDGDRPERIGNRSFSSAPQGCYRCAGEDQWCVISVENDDQWLALATLMSSQDLLHNPEFRELSGRIRHRELIDKHIGAWTSARTSIQVEDELRAVGVQAQHMRRMDELLPRNRDSVFQLRPDREKPTLLTGLPFRFLPVQDDDLGEAPRLGEHTQAALAAWLKIDRAEIAELQALGALS